MQGTYVSALAPATLALSEYTVLFPELPEVSGRHQRPWNASEFISSDPGTPMSP